MKTLPRLLVSTTLFAAALATGGCVAAIGNSERPPANVTLGQQLIDLQKARDTGAISENEYQVQRAKFLARK